MNRRASCLLYSVQAELFRETAADRTDNILLYMSSALSLRVDERRAPLPRYFCVSSLLLQPMWFSNTHGSESVTLRESNKVTLKLQQCTAREDMLGEFKKGIQLHPASQACVRLSIHKDTQTHGHIQLSECTNPGSDKLLLNQYLVNKYHTYFIFAAQKLWLQSKLALCL